MTNVKPSLELEVQAKVGSIGTIDSNIELVKAKAEEIKSWYLNLAVTEDMLPDAKADKAIINKLKSAVSSYRKDTIAEFKKPIDYFEKTAKETERILGEAYDAINDQVRKYEDERRAEKNNEIRNAFNEYAKELGIDFVDYDRLDINVTLSAKTSDLIDTAKSYLDVIATDLKAIDAQEHKAEILTEYKRTLSLSDAITTVNERLKAEAAERERLAVLETQKIAAKANNVENAEPVHHKYEVKVSVTYTFDIIADDEDEAKKAGYNAFYSDYEPKDTKIDCDVKFVK